MLEVIKILFEHAKSVILVKEQQGKHSWSLASADSLFPVLDVKKISKVYTLG